MQLRTGSAVLATALVALGVSAPMASAAREPLNAYLVAPTQDNKQRLAKAGYDMLEADHGEYLEVYGTAKQAAELKKEGLAHAAGQGQHRHVAVRRRPRRQRRDLQRLAPLRPRRRRQQGAVPRAL